MYIKLKELDPRLRFINLLIGEEYHSNLFSSNVYQIGNNDITLVDAGDGCKSNNVLIALQKLNLDVENITNVIVTHSHDDHWGGLVDLLQVIPLNILVYKDDVEYFIEQLNLIETNQNYEIVGLDDGDIIKTEGYKLRVIYTPGHDSGSICLYDEECKILFSGDTVFATGTTGSARSGSIDELKKSLKRLTTIDIEFLLPGHGDIAYKNANDAIRLALQRLNLTDVHKNNNLRTWMRHLRR